MKYLILMLLANVAMAKEIYPIPEDGCGAWGNVIATAQNMKNHGVDLHEVILSILESEKNCEVKFGAEASDKCLLPSADSKTWAMEQFKIIWSGKQKDPTTAGFDAYASCLESNKGKGI